MNKVLKVVGFDPSLRNWGIAQGLLTLSREGELIITNLDVIQPILPTGKQVRQNSLDLETALQLAKTAIHYASQADVIFVEVPIGSQSARAMASYGICVGVLGAIRALGIPFFEVTPTEVKLAATGSKTATKEDMINWAVGLHPEANWPTSKHKGIVKVTAGNAEHMADAIGAIYAGISSNLFNQTLSIFKTN